MADYAFKLTAQQWRNDSYYVGSNAPIHELTVVAATKEEALTEAVRVLGPSSRDRYWRFWVKSMTDVRLVPAEGATT